MAPVAQYRVQPGSMSLLGPRLVQVLLLAQLSALVGLIVFKLRSMRS